MPPSRGVRTRRRPAHSCTECRRRKVRCDRAKPCGQCSAHNIHACTYVETYHRGPSREVSAHTDSGPIAIAQATPERLQTNCPPSTSVSADRIHGALNKTRVFGHGHWMNAMSMVDGLTNLQPLLECYHSIFHQDGSDPQDPFPQTVAECKQLARDAKRQRPSRRRLPVDVYLSIPGRGLVDELVQLYFTTFESCYRILHFPSFREEYDEYINHLETAKSSFVVELLLAISAAGVLHSDATVRSEISAKSRSWIETSQAWLSAPLEKDRLTIKGIQIHCLLLLARQANRLGADLVWISAGSLLRMAMQMGLHQDPDHLGKIPAQQKDLRRCLWYTILEMNVQAALDSGMSPMFTEGDYNTRPPTVVSDKDLGVQEDTARTTGTVCSQTLLQPLLARSLPLRLKIARVISSMQEEPSYDDVQRLEDDLARACRDATLALDHNNNGVNSNDTPPTSQFAISFFTHLLRRFALCLHFPYAIKAQKNPVYSHSHKVCLGAALDLVSLLDDALYSRLLLTGGGMFRDLITRGSFVLYLELTSDLETDTSIFARKRNRALREPLLRDARRVAEYAKERMWYGETNIKGYVFISMGTAQIEALLDGSSSREAALNAARESLDTCREILRAAAANGSHSESHATAGLGTLNPMESSLTNTDGEFDLLDDGSLDFDFEGSLFPQLWVDEAWH